jgi:hypothetical protein
VSAIEKSTFAGPKVLHLHWLNVVLAGTKSDSDINSAIAIFEKQLDRAIAAGAKIAWTVHNVLPHESFQKEPSIRVRNLVVERASMIHIMSPETVAACAPFFEIPSELVVRCEHAGYNGYFNSPVAATDILRMWGLPHGGKTGVIIGGIKPYKGLNEFAEQFVSATAHNPRSLQMIIAGKPDDDFLKSKLFALAELSPNLHVIPRMITDDQVAGLMTAADFSVIPYQSSLNSGALVLGLTFGNPVLARQSAGSTHLLESGAGRVYSDDNELASLLNNPDWIDTARPHAERLSRELDHDVVTNNFARMIRSFALDSVHVARETVGSNGGMNV